MEAGDLNLDEPKSRQVLNMFPVAHKISKRQNDRELARLQGGEPEMPLYVTNDYGLRKGMTIALHIEPEDLGKPSLPNPERIAARPLGRHRA